MLYIVITKTHMSIFKISLKAIFNIFWSILLKLRINDIYIYTEVYYGDIRTLKIKFPFKFVWWAEKRSYTTRYSRLSMLNLHKNVCRTDWL